MKDLDGILLTGGATPLKISSSNTVSIDNSSDNESELSSYTLLVSWILKTAKYINKNDKFFPIWGSCLGFESIILSEMGKNFEFDWVDNTKHNARIYYDHTS